MEVFSLPERIRGLFFDIDNTLYTHEAYAAHQYDVLYQALSRHLGARVSDLRGEIEAWRSSQAAARGGKPSLGTAFAHWEADIETSVLWRSRYIRPEQYLTEDRRLQETLRRFAGPEDLAMVAVTNNPSDIGWRTLECLGIRGFFAGVVGLDHTLASKPDSDHFDRALAIAGLPPERCVSIGDRFGIDIAPALERGMGGILVDGVREVYELPGLIGPVITGGGAAKPSAGGNG
jgi:FMN phosphatase YigB (HAD superfamily)